MSLFYDSLVEYMKSISHDTVGRKIIRALLKIPTIFHWLDCQSLSSHEFINSIRSKDHDLTNIHCTKLH